jgi:hypothetical protein
LHITYSFYARQTYKGIIHPVLAAFNTIMAEKPHIQKLDFGLEVEDRPPAPPSPQAEEESKAIARLERRLKRKLDYIILPCLALAYFLSSMVSE